MCRMFYTRIISERPLPPGTIGKTFSVWSVMKSMNTSRSLSLKASLTDDVHALADRIARLLSDDTIAEAMARRNLELVRAKASQAAHMRHMEEVYRRIVAQDAATIARARPGT